MNNEQKYTTKVIEGINKASDITKDNHLSQVDVPELLRALFDQDNSLYVNILKRIDVDSKLVSQEIDNAISHCVKTTSNEDPSTSSDLNNILYNATKYEKEFSDEYMSVEHLLLAQFDVKHSLVLKLKNIENYTKENFLKAIKAIRGNTHVTSDNPEAQYEALKNMVET